jgi:alkaline phosphatase D
MPTGDAHSDRAGGQRAASNGADYSGLVSALTESDLAMATDVREPADEGTISFDPEAEPAETFPQSVASGDPTPTGVVCWTRVDPDAHDPSSPLALQVAADEGFDDIVVQGVITDQDAVTAHDHTVKVDLDGVLDPGETYYYQFVHDGVASQTGRCRTLPHPDASPESVSFAVLTCQNFQNGYYPAYHYVAEADVDFIVHVGDFIYEDSGEGFKGLGSPDMPDRRIDLPSGHDRVRTLADYRTLYRTYRRDPFLQRALERHTIIPAWDDHEISNDVYWDDDVDAPAADHPRGDDPEFMTRLTADAIHAWWEFMPSRIDYDPDAESLQDRFELWRQFEFGDLVSMIMTDERLFRDGPRETGLLPFPLRDAVNPDGESADRSMLGEDQREWFLDAVDSASGRWTVWTDEVLTVPFKLGAPPVTLYPVQGGWDGYTRERRYITNEIAEMDVENFVTLTGDMHSYVVGYKQTEYGDPFDGAAPKEARVGVEFMTPAIASLTVGEALGLNRGLRRRLTEPLLTKLITWMNPHIDFFNSHRCGYAVVEFTRDDCTYVGYSVDKTVDSAAAARDVVAAYRLPDGDLELENVTERYRET